MKDIGKWREYITDDDVMKATLGATRLFGAAPSIVEPDEPFALHIVALGADGYPDESYRDNVRLETDADVRGLPEVIEFGADDEGIVRVDGLSAPGEGIVLIRFSCDRTQVGGACNPIWVKRDPPYRIYWGDLHTHSILGKCGTQTAKSPDFGYRFGRDVMRLDYAAMADHARSLDDESWKEVMAAAKRHHEAGEFVTFLGFEGDYDGPDGGHFNLYYRGDDGDYRNFRVEKGGTLDAVHDFAKERGALAVSHHNGRRIRGRDYSISRWGGLEIEPVVEVYSKWGSSEEWHSHRPVWRGGYPSDTHYFRYAVAHGYRLGVIGGSDDHSTCPGSYMDMWYPRDAGRRGFYRSSGLGAILATELTREALWDAMFHRRCYATAGERFLVDLRVDGHLMGEEIGSRRPHIEARVVGPAGIREVVIVKDGQDWHRVDSPGQDCAVELVDDELESESSYYVRAIDQAGDAAWSSPIWVRRE